MLRRPLLALFLLLALTAPARAQFVPQHNRSFVASPQALGMGDAVVALPMQQSSFFYNPAHVAHARFHLTLVGARIAVSDNLFDQVAFFQDELRPALDTGIENLPADELETLYRETLAIGRQSTFLQTDLLAPSFAMHLGPIGFGLGAFGSSHIRYSLPDAGGGLPLINLEGIADAMVVGSVGMDLSSFGAKGFSAGLNGKYTRRYVTFKSRPLDVFSESEAFALLSGSRVGVDLGVLYQRPAPGPLPGTVNIGLTMFDILGSDFAYAYDRTLQGVANAVEVANDVARAEEDFAIAPSFRLGVAYALPKLPGGLLDEAGVALDYVGYSEAAVDQAFLAHIRLGVQARVKILSVRAGLNQGYPTVGGGLSLGVIDFDYAYYGAEGGRYPGQLASWHHSGQIRIGL
ncbi:MAG: hypothetical protein SH809_20470 [Rhodothermales bacterium]|nr:hypothetical protein [Rhodothermales bacterium]